MASSSSTHRVDNFNAGPAALPLEVVEIAQRDMLNYNNTGMGVMEISHRSKSFESLLSNARDNIRNLLAVPSNYRIFFITGGGTGQFAAVPLNFLGIGGGDRTEADYLITGAWSKAAAEEARKYCQVNIVATSEKQKFNHIPARATWQLNSNSKSAYFYYCHNETVHGVEFSDIPSDIQLPIVSDFSSCFMSSSSVDISKYACIFAGAQKNVGPAGVTIVIVNESFLGRASKICPVVLDYTITAEKDSLYNTPPCWNIYVCGLVFEWILKHGGMKAITERNKEKARMLYEAIDNSQGFYVAKVQDVASRSRMNVVWDIANDDRNTLLNDFVSSAEKQGLVGLAGHRSLGGIRASLYNAITIEQTRRLVDFMHAFQKKHSK